MALDKQSQQIEQPAEGGESAAQSARTKLSSTFSDQRLQAKEPLSEPAHLDMNSPFPSGGADRQPQATDATPRVPAVPAAPGERSQWTMGVDLTTTQGGGSDRGPSGAENQFARLQQMASESRGSDVSFVVQAAIPGTVEQRGDSISRSNWQVQRYLIRNGQIEELPTQPSDGIRNDLRNLLQTANEYAPSERIGLIMQSHGTPARGLESDVGRISLEDLNATIRDGLSGSGHDRLDVLDFDACSMSSARSLDGLNGVARTVVASAETEHSFGNADAQNLNAIARALMANPQMDAQQLGQRMVELAASGANTDTSGGEHDGRSGTPDLQSINMDQQPAFQQSLDRFGAALNTAWGNEGNRQELNRLIGQAPAYEEGRSQDRDLPTFANAVRNAITAGRISDADGSLLAATQNLLSTERQLITAHFGEDQGGYAAMGGLSAYLPDATSRDIGNRAAETSPQRELSEWLQMPKVQGFDKRESLAESIDRHTNDMESVVGGDREEFARLHEFARSMRNAADEGEYSTALQETLRYLQSMDGTSTGQQLTWHAGEEIRRRQRSQAQDHNVSNAPNWNEFINRLFE